MPNYVIAHQNGKSWEVQCQNAPMLMQIIRNRIAAREALFLDSPVVKIVNGKNVADITDANYSDLFGCEVEYEPGDQTLEAVTTYLDSLPLPAFPLGAPPAPTEKKRPAFWLRYYLTWLDNLPKNKFDKIQKVYSTMWPLEQIHLLLNGCLQEMSTREPQIHSTIQGKLSPHHPLAFEPITCGYALPRVEQLGEWLANPIPENPIERIPCENLVHTADNVTVAPWVECENLNYCLNCFLYACQIQPFESFALKEQQ